MMLLNVLKKSTKNCGETAWFTMWLFLDHIQDEQRENDGRDIWNPSRKGRGRAVRTIKQEVESASEDSNPQPRSQSGKEPGNQLIQL